MMEKVLDYGLKESYNFKEIHVPTTQDLDDIHDKVVTDISPAIIELETSKLINGFFFISHKAIDVRLSSNNWKKNEKKIREILRKHKLSDDLKNCEPLPPEDYGGDIGVILCYNNLEFNSRLIMALLDAQKLTDDMNMKRQLEGLLHQWIHYLYIQYGIYNELEMDSEFRRSLSWVWRLYEKSNDKEWANTVLKDMNNAINQLKNKINK